MARKKQQVDERKTGFAERPPREFRPVEGAVRLVTVSEKDGPPPDKVAGAIVRVRLNPAEERDPEFQAWLARAREVALRVVVLPATEDKPLPDAAREAAPRAEDARRVVAAMVEEATVGDRDALRALAEVVMGEVGL